MHCARAERTNRSHQYYPDSPASEQYWQARQTGDAIHEAASVIGEKRIAQVGRGGRNNIAGHLAKTYVFRSFALGRAGTFSISPIPGKQGYVWVIPAGPISIRYTATIEGGKWHEVGDRLVPGKEPVRFFDMLLTRLGDSDWPGAGAMTPR